MQSGTDIGALNRRLDESSRTHARIEGRRAGLREQEQELVATIGLAKGKAAIKKEVEAFVEQVQAEAYRKTTHSFSTLLSTLSKEVLPHSHPVEMELTTERSLPALHLHVRGRNGVKEDVYQDHGGALNNVISMGLRLIAVVKTNGKRFLALDEPECWVKPDRIPAFFNVLESSASKLSVQTIVITHHDASAAFGPEVRISTLAGSRELGARIESSRAPYEWSDVEDGFRYIRLQNFQTYVDATMHLGPGVNALIGPNDLGKSAILRALAGMFYGSTNKLRDSLIRHDAKSMTVEIGLAKGRMLRLVRARQGNPKNLWSLHEADGSIVEENGTAYETKGNKPPEWVDAMFGLANVDDLGIHIADQKEPVFLLNRPASQRASVLAIGQEAGYTSDMLAIHKEWTNQNNATIKDGERRVADLRSQLQDLAPLDDIGELLQHAREASANVVAWREYVGQIERIAAALKNNVDRVAAARRRAECHVGLPSAERIAEARESIDGIASAARTMEVLTSTRARLALAKDKQRILASLPEELPKNQHAEEEAAASALLRSRTALARAERRLATLKSLPDTMPMTPVIAGAEVFAKLGDLRTRIAGLQTQHDAMLEEEKTIRAEMAETMTDLGGHCPTCGHAATPEDMLQQHSHEAA